ncbi:glutathione S-transferase family protein [Devosia sp.]|uniref:glutathione S-transferase family protein n=1 Tax=Devosia sp. TaxID=1871048 RepID=UPI001AD021C2|nr:glutathione S-transferase family protein [Devosia sp.]MBN9334339.1 glutathione S-transferase family protein [Devosia sp.]
MSESQPFIVYGASGSGSVPIEAALELLGLPYRLEEHEPWKGSAETERLAAINPMAQVPAVRLPSGEVMTESAAILIWLADRYPEGRLAPAIGDARRPDFLRWMTFVSSAIYALYWVTDNPSRVLEDAGGHDEIKAKIYRRIESCWALMGEQLAPQNFLLGEEIGVLDLYVATASRWSPDRRRFYEVAPSLAGAIRRTDSDPRLSRLWARRFPFEPGWER